MASRTIAIPVPVRKSINADRFVLAVAIACAAVSVFVAWRALAPTSATPPVAGIETARTVDFSRFAQK